MAKDDFQEMLAIAEQVKAEMTAMLNDMASQVGSLQSSLAALQVNMDEQTAAIQESTASLKSIFDNIKQQISSLGSANVGAGNLFNDVSGWFF